jgi:VanZ family protein
LGNARPNSNQDIAAINVRNAHFFTRTSLLARIGLALVTFLIAYGSLFPFEFADPGPIAGLLPAFVNEWSLLSSRGDILGNIALFLPFGLLGSILARTSSAPVWAHAICFVGGIAFAFACQIAQMYLPARSAALGDVAWNAAGIALGMLAAGWGRSVVGPDARLQPLVFPGFIAMLWITAELAPLVPTLSLSSMKDNLAAILRPQFDWPDAVLSAAGVMLVGALAESSLGARRAQWAVPALIATVVAGKILVIQAGLGVGTCTGLLLGYWGWLSVYRHRASDAAITVAAVMLLAAVTVRGLAPLDFRTYAGDWHWIPFNAWLEGSLLANVQSLAASVFLYGALLGLIAATRRHVLGSSIALALWVTVLEIAQLWLEGRSGDITEPLLVIAIGVTLKALLPILPFPSVIAQHRPPHAPPAPSPPWWRPWVEIAVVGTLIAWALGLVLSLPRIPYNVRELFLDDASFLPRFAFGLALLWIGMGAVLAGQWVLRSRLPLLAWPLAIACAGLVSLLLLSTSVTQESIGDISGSNNLYWFVTNRNIWGSWWREIVLWIGSPALIAFLERPVRFIALYAPLLVFLAIAWIAAAEVAQQKIDWKRFGWICASVLPWLWLAKAIAFDWSSTDNLNELIAPEGTWGLGGGAYLYCLLALIAVSAVLVARLNEFSSAALCAIVTLTLATPVGWWLLEAGIHASVEKYSSTFSGTQFLLGPDRRETLASVTLFFRWSIIQMTSILLLAVGIRIGQSLYASALASLPKTGAP